ARARRYASFIGADLLIVDKHRKRPNEVASMQVIGDPTNKNIILVDDLIDTAGTICKAADLLIEKGAISVRAITTHPLLSGQAYERVEASKLHELVVTDTIPLRKESHKIKVLSIAPVFAKAFRKIHNYESISSLFIN
ncbi:MAG: ribose-phosphate diphosphokinase, partial [Bacteroidota bacterium]